MNRTELNHSFIYFFTACYYWEWFLALHNSFFIPFCYWFDYCMLVLN